MKRWTWALILLLAMYLLVGSCTGSGSAGEPLVLADSAGAPPGPMSPRYDELVPEYMGILERWGGDLRGVVIARVTAGVRGVAINYGRTVQMQHLLVMQAPAEPAEWRRTLAHEMGHIAMWQQGWSVADYRRTFDLAGSIPDIGVMEIMAEHFALCYATRPLPDGAGTARWGDPDTRELVLYFLVPDSPCDWFEQ